MSRRVLFKKELIDLRQQLVKVEVAPEFISTLAGYKKAAEVTPDYFTILALNPVLAEPYQERKREALLQMVLAVIYLKNGWFYAYMSAEIYADLVRHGKP